MEWKNLTLATTSGRADMAEVMLWDAGAVSVTVEDGGDQPLLEPGPGETPTWDRVIITGLFEDNIELAEITHRLSKAGLMVIDTQVLGDRIWEREWMERFKPVCFADRLWICPSGYSVEADLVLHLDPGLAFGTGSHPTTGMCLTWLAEHNLNDAIVVDYGCGSGILAIAAGILGAQSVIATDNDPQAMTATKDNANRNGVQDKINCLEPGQLDQIDGPADIVVANILAGPLVELKENLLPLLSNDGVMVLSGILKEQSDWLISAYQPEVELTIAKTMDDWVLLEGYRTV